MVVWAKVEQMFFASNLVFRYTCLYGGTVVKIASRWEALSVFPPPQNEVGKIHHCQKTGMCLKTLPASRLNITEALTRYQKRKKKLTNHIKNKKHMRETTLKKEKRTSGKTD